MAVHKHKEHEENHFFIHRGGVKPGKTLGTSNTNPSGWQTSPLVMLGHAQKHPQTTTPTQNHQSTELSFYISTESTGPIITSP